MLNLTEVFDKYEDDYLKFKEIDINKRLSSRPDMHAFFLLNFLVPCPNEDIVTGAGHDIIYLNVDCKKLARVATEENIQDLRRCGVMYDRDHECLTMFV